MYSVEHQLQELQLIRCSLLRGEVFSFVLPSEDMITWTSLLDVLDSGVDGEIELPTKGTSLCSATFSVKVAGLPVWFEVQVPEGPIERSDVLVRGENISRYQQERWQSIILPRYSNSLRLPLYRFPIYELLSLHLLPRLHDTHRHPQAWRPSEIHSHRPEIFHALLTSHHLISPTKRKLMKGWSSELHVTGFAKVGYPGLIYAEGEKENVEEFVKNMKAMNLAGTQDSDSLNQWRRPTQAANTGDEWVEVQKISEVLELMRKKGRNYAS
ncbi:hypothetical protein EDD16DRAFT_1841704 [Pisolithus croceorrhizus]|nr:hypothetical protein EDD16DRAFT_1841704 [Pisolithus croceorrhizus]